MNLPALNLTAKALVADGKGILAADETVGTITKRFDQLDIASTPESRRDYREMLFMAPGAGDFISGVITYDETLRQLGARGGPIPEILKREGIIPGIKVDTGAKPLAGCEGEMVSEGLDGLRERLKEYQTMGARFAKWRAVIHVTENLPSDTCVNVNAHALGRYAALCQEQGLVPIVEPEVLMDGNHTIERCENVTGTVLDAVFNALREQRVWLEGTLLKPNMIVSGKACASQASVPEVATATLRCLLRHVPAVVPGIVFLSGGQSDVVATEHLNAISVTPGIKPWKISFSYGRALQDQALGTWRGNNANSRVAQQAYYHRARCNSAASLGKYNSALEDQIHGELTKGHRSAHEDD